MAASKKSITQIEIPTPEAKLIRVRFSGEKLLLNPMNEKVPNIPGDPELDKVKTKRTKTYAKVSIEDEVNRRRTLDAQGRDCVELYHLKAGLVSAAKFIDGIAQTDVRQLVYVHGELAPLSFKELRPAMHVVREGKFPNKTPRRRHRPEYLDWSFEATIEFNANFLNVNQVIALCSWFGAYVGFGDYRIEKGGAHGRCEVELAAVVKKRPPEVKSQSKKTRARKAA